MVGGGNRGGVDFKLSSIEVLDPVLDSDVSTGTVTSSTSKVKVLLYRINSFVIKPVHQSVLVTSTSKSRCIL